mmetsp:Transcript_39697/g.86449  ORF Transcript_39697/g.86449 Transcript_39697/m.86449 type:complete len:244 (+) Transcript_39697:1535-2266(+)
MSAPYFSTLSCHSVHRISVPSSSISSMFSRLRCCPLLLKERGSPLLVTRALMVQLFAYGFSAPIGCTRRVLDAVRMEPIFAAEGGDADSPVLLFASRLKVGVTSAGFSHTSSFSCASTTEPSTTITFFSPPCSRMLYFVNITTPYFSSFASCATVLKSEEVTAFTFALPSESSSFMRVALACSIFVTWRHTLSPTSESKRATPPCVTWSAMTYRLLQFNANDNIKSLEDVRRQGLQDDGRQHK